MNLLLGGVNLLPAFPLDGGRIVRGLAWARTGDPARALRIARLVRSVSRDPVRDRRASSRILLVDSIDGLMLALCGWFIVSSASAIERNADVDAMLDGISVADVMDHDVPGVPPGLTLDTFAEQILDEARAATVPVMRGRDLLGLIGREAVRRVRRDRLGRHARRGPDGQRRRAAAGRAGDVAARRASIDCIGAGWTACRSSRRGALTGIVTRRAVAEGRRRRPRATGCAAGGAPAS